GLPAAGRWKTTIAGETWTPMFDAITAASSVGAVEVAPSDPNLIYVGMCDLSSGGGINEGNGVYKSVDAGRTWQHLGLDSTKQIPSILVDPHDPNLVMIAAQGDVHKKSESRGVFRSTDGGKTWTRTLYVDDSTGLQKVTWAGDRPDVVLATSVRHYVTPITGPARVPAAAPQGASWPPPAGASPTARGATPAASTSTLRTPTSCTPSTHPATSPPTAATRSPASRAPPAATTRSRCGSTPPTASASSWGS